MTVVLFLVAGLALISLGGEGLVRGAGATARRFGVSTVVVALTLVAFGTSSPELAVNTSAAFRDATDLAFGNVLGSNIANLLLVLGLAALVFPPDVHLDLIRRESPLLLALHVLLVILVLDGRLGRVDGAILLACAAVYLGVLVRVGRRTRLPEGIDPGEAAGRGTLPLWRAILYVIGGLGGLTLGAHLFVGGALELVDMLGVSQRVVGLTVAAIGTSLPEISASVIASLRRTPDLAVGNAIGSCIFNLAIVLGLTSLLHPLPIDASVRGGVGVDLAVAIAAAALLVPVLSTGRRIDRIEGAVLLTGYGAYLTYLAVAGG